MIWRGASTGSRFTIIRDIALRFDPDDVDVGFTDLAREKAQYRKLLKELMEEKDILSYKYLLSIEGNDVASGLKWMLASNSVVFMPQPTVVSWAMEDLLVPWYHYIPLADDCSDLEEKLEWARSHDSDCKLIAEQSKQFISDLVVSKQAQQDNEEIVRQVKRYEESFSGTLRLCPRA